MKKLTGICILIGSVALSVASPAQAEELPDSLARTEAEPNDPDLFNERGFLKSDSYTRLTEYEQVSDFNGNLTMSIPLFHHKGVDELDVAIDLIYNGSAPFTRIDDHSQAASGHYNNYQVNQFSKPAWFLSLNGYMVLPLHFNVALLNVHEGAGVPPVADGDAAQLVTGYGISDRGYQPHSTLTDRDDNLYVALGDGSAEEFDAYATGAFGQRNGWFGSADPGVYARAARNPIGQCDEANPLTLQKSDGSMYTFNSICLDAAMDFLQGTYQPNGRIGQNNFNGPLALRLAEIETRGDARISIGYEPMEDLGNGGVWPGTWIGELCPKTVTISDANTPSDYSIEVIVGDPQVLPPDSVVVYNTYVENEVTVERHWGIKLGWQLNGSNEVVQWYVEALTDPEGRRWTFEYEDDGYELGTRKRFNYGGDCNEEYEVYAQRLKTVHYPTGGRTEYSYVDCFECVLPRCGSSEPPTARFQDGSWRKMGRSVFHTNMVETVQRYASDAGGTAETTTSYSYDWSKEGEWADPPSPTNEQFWSVEPLSHEAQRFTTTVTTTSDGSPLQTKRTYTFKKIPYNNGEASTYSAQWLSRLIEMKTEDENIVTESDLEQYTSYDYDADLVDPAGGSYDGSFKQERREVRYGDPATGPGFEESWTYDPVYFTKSSHTRPDGTVASYDYYHYEEDWLNGEPESFPVDATKWFLIDMPTRETLVDGSSTVSDVEWLRINEDAPETETNRAGAIIDQEIRRLSAARSAVTTYDYAFGQCNLCPSVIDGPAGEHVEYNWGLKQLPGGVDLNGLGIVPTEVKEHRIPSDPTPLVRRYSLNGRVQLDYREDENGIIRRYQYDDLGRLTERTQDGVGVLESFSYPDPNRIIRDVSVSAAEQIRNEFIIDGRDRIEKVVVGVLEPRETVETFVRSELVATRTDPEGRTTRFEYDGLGRAVRTVHPDGSVSTTNYFYYDDVSGYRAELQYPFGTLDFVEAEEVTDPEGEVTVLFRDSAGRLVATSQHDGPGQEPEAASYYKYDGAGRLTAIADPIGATTTYTYDWGGNLLNVSHPDELGVARVSLAANFDAGGQPPEGVTDIGYFVPTGSTVEYDYSLDIVGSRPLAAVPRVRIKNTVTGQILLEDTTPGSSGQGTLGVVAGDTYEVLCVATDNAQLVRAWVDYTALGAGDRTTIYDSSGRVRFRRHPRMSAEEGTDVWLYEKYDLAGRSVETGKIVGVTVGTLNSVVDDPSYPTNGTVLVSRDYDSVAGWSGSHTIGRLVQEETLNPLTGLTLSRLVGYDAMGNVSEEELSFSTIAAGSYGFSYSYDWTGKVTSVIGDPPTGPSHGAFTGYTEHGDVDWVGPSGTGSAPWASYDYYLDGGSRSVLFSNDSWLHLSWNDRGWMEEWEFRAGDGTQYQDRYFYLDNGRMASRVSPQGESFGYDYDSPGRLVGVDRYFDGSFEADISYGYDASGNRTSATSVLGGFDYEVEPGRHRLLEVSPSSSAPGEQTTYGYHSDGSVASKSRSLTLGSASQPVSFDQRSYNWQDRVSEVESVEYGRPGAPIQSSTVRYDYDAAGHEIRRDDGTEVTYLLRDNWGGVRAELRSDGLPERWLVRPGATGGGGVAGSGKENGQPGTPIAYLNAIGSLQQFLHADNLGSVRFLTDGAGEIVEARDYLPFGEEIAVGGSLALSINPSELGFGGKREEKTVGELRFGARWNGTAVGRFGAIDPVCFSPPAARYLTAPQLLHPYAYAANSPLIFTDATGESVFAAYNKTMEPPFVLGAAGMSLAASLSFTEAVANLFGVSLVEHSDNVSADGDALPADAGEVGEASDEEVAPQTDAEDEPAREKGQRMTSKDSAQDQLEEIETAQAKSRKGKSDKIIDSIEKSKQRLKQALKEAARNHEQ